MILAIETSCDESAAALFDPGHGVTCNLVHSQIALHRPYGGVVPELAAREHLQNLFPLLKEILSGLAPDAIRKVAVTRGPGLAGCLSIGIAAAKAIALDLGVGVVGINHLRAHAFSPFLPTHAAGPDSFGADLASLLPHFGLIVSGGNTVAVEILPGPEIRVLAATVDDAAGEALDKGAKLLGLPYPGGPEIERLGRTGKPDSFDFPRAFPDPSDRRFSFSGLKTSLRYTLEKLDDPAVEAAMPDLTASFEEAVVDQLIRKCRHLLDCGSFRSLGLSGGVANNRNLRDRFTELGSRRSLPTLLVPPAYSGDNAAMIAFAAMVDPPPAFNPAAVGTALGLDPSLRLEEY